MVVVEAVDDAARDAEHLARADVGLFSVDRPGQHALKPVDRLLITVVAVRDRQSGRLGRVNSKTATEPPSHFPSSRNRIASPPSDLVLGLVYIVL